MSSESPLEVIDKADQSSEAAAVENPAAEANVSAHPSGLDSLRRKMELKGVVKRVELQGAVIDVGLEKDGLLHISQLDTDEHAKVKNVTDVLKVGQQVVVYVLAVDKKRGRIDLTMVKPPALGWDELKVNDNYAGTVVRIEKFGVFVDIGAERPGLIHVSELTTGFVPDPSEIVKIGDAVEAKLIGVNRRKKQIDLSVRALQTEAAEQEASEATEETSEPQLTAMEVALRRAMETSGKELIRQDKKRQKRKTRFAEQEDIFSRTLRMHDKS